MAESSFSAYYLCYLAWPALTAGEVSSPVRTSLLGCGSFHKWHFQCTLNTEIHAVTINIILVQHHPVPVCPRQSTQCHVPPQHFVMYVHASAAHRALPGVSSAMPSVDRAAMLHHGRQIWRGCLALMCKAPIPQRCSGCH